jgi:hypothetical protein
MFAVLKELYEIRYARNSKTTGRQRQSIHTANALYLALPRLVRDFVQNAPFGSKPVFFPESFKMDKRRLTQAINSTLKS